jgi:hypothetical protein
MDFINEKVLENPYLLNFLASPIDINIYDTSLFTGTGAELATKVRFVLVLLALVL